MTSDDWDFIGVGLFFMTMGILSLRSYDAWARRYEERQRLRKPTLLSRYMKALAFGGSLTSKGQRLQAMIVAWLAILVGLALIAIWVIARISGWSLT